MYFIGGLPPLGKAARLRWFEGLCTKPPLPHQSHTGNFHIESPLLFLA